MDSPPISPGFAGVSGMEKDEQMASEFEKRLVDATPPDDFPDQVIITDHECKKAPYYLRVKIENGVDHVELSDIEGPVQTLVGAVQVSVAKGYDPTHYVDGHHGPWLIPSSIVRRPARLPSEATRSK